MVMRKIGNLTMEATFGDDMKNSGWLSDSDMTDVQSVSVRHSTSLHASITWSTASSRRARRSLKSMRNVLQRLRNHVSAIT
jgi:hypothetical protein